MKGVNKVILVGNLGQDPELRYTGSGTAVANLRLATTDSYKNRDGERVEKTEWHNLVAWDKVAEILNEYAGKGTPLYIEGSLQTRSWEDRDGNTRYTTEVKIQEFTFLGGNKNNNNGGQNGSQGNSSAAAQGQGPAEEASFEPDDDLPF